MAHVKVERRSMSLLKWAQIMFDQVAGLVIIDREPTRDWTVQIGDYFPEGYCWDAPPRPIESGQLWGKPDGAALFNGTAMVPARMAGQSISLRMRVAAEVILSVGGKFLDGLDPNRETTALASKAIAGHEYQLQLEAYSRSKPDDERNVNTRAHRGCVQKFNTPELVVVDHAAQTIHRRLLLLHAAAFGAEFPEDIRQWLQARISELLRVMPPFESSSEELRAALPEVKKFLDQRVFGGSSPFGNSGKLACVAHSHLDVAYHWRVRQSVQKNARTCLIQLRLMDRFPNFLYAHSQAWTYETLEKHYPELFEQVRERVVEGRWEIVGGMYVEPDCNLLGAESMCRQILYGKRYFLEKFGVDVDNCWLPDVFGNSAIMPQILKAGGIDYFVSNKMSTWNDTNAFPHNNFLWRGIDGSVVRACVPPIHFITWNDPNQLVESWQRFLDKNVFNESLHMYGYGDGGSGATPEMIENLNPDSRVPGTPELRQIAAKNYLHEAFAGIENENAVGVWDGELYLEMHRGTFTTKAELKKCNRRAEFLALETEALVVLAALRGGHTAAADQLRDAWKLLMINQFHDILPGSHTHAVYEDALVDYAKADNLLNNAGGKAIAAISRRESNCAIVFNPFAHPVSGVAVVEGTENDAYLQAQDGTIHPFQRQAKPGGGEQLIVETGTVQPLAVQNYTLGKSRTQAYEDEHIDEFDISFDKMENRFFIVHFDQRRRICQIFSKLHNRQILSQNDTGNQWQLFEDRPGTYNAWDLLDRFEDHPIPVPDWGTAEIVETGPVSIALRQKLKFANSSAEQIIRLYKNIPRLDFETFVDWQESERVLKVAFPLQIHAPVFETDTSAGTLVRPNHRNTSWEQARFEVCCHKWVRMGEGQFGVALMNDSKYGCDVKGNVMRLTLLRAPVRPDSTSDKGKHRFCYSIFADDGDWRRSALVEQAFLLNHPPRLLSGWQANDSVQRSLLTIDAPALKLQALKMAEDNSEDIILRLVELYGSHGTAQVKFDMPLTKADFCDLLERKQNPCDRSGSTLTFDYRPYQIFTLRICCGC